MAGISGAPPAPRLGLNTKTGKRVFTFDSSGYTPVVSDGANVFLVGYKSIWGLKQK